MAKRVAFFSFIAVSLLLFTGCGGAEAMPTAKEKSSLPSTLPGWVLSPGIEGYLSGVGHAAPQETNPAYQRRVAMMQARAAIGRAIEVYVQTELTTEKTCTDDACRSRMQSRSHHLSEQLIREAILKNEWTDPKTGVLYIRLVIKKRGE